VPVREQDALNVVLAVPLAVVVKLPVSVGVRVLLGEVDAVSVWLHVPEGARDREAQLAENVRVLRVGDTVRVQLSEGVGAEGVWVRVAGLGVAAREVVIEGESDTVNVGETVKRSDRLAVEERVPEGVEEVERGMVCVEVNERVRVVAVSDRGDAVGLQLGDGFGVWVKVIVGVPDGV
jgi:hypothetical protein